MRVTVSVGLALALALALAAAAVSAAYPAPWNPPLTREQQQRVDNYTPRFPHSPTPRNNPCRAVCASSEAAAASEECITCCRTARHRVPWNCAAPSGAHGDANPTRDAHSGVPTKCCTEWSAECWDRPSADNYEHSCDMCVAPPFYYNQTLPGCNSTWTTPACWQGGAVPPDDPSATSSSAIVHLLSGSVYVPATVQTPIPSGMNANTFYISGGFKLTLAPGAVLAAHDLHFVESLTAPALITALGTGLQFAAVYTYYDVVSNPNPYFVLAPRNAVFDLGDLQNGVGTIRVDNTYDASASGATPPPAGPPAPQVRYLSPRYHSTVLAWWSHAPFASTTFLEVIGDSGLVTIAFSTPNDGANRLPFRSTVKVDGTYGAKLQLTGQAAGWYASLPNGGQAYAPFIAGTQSSPLAVTLANGGAISFANYTELDVVTFAVTGTAPVFVEFLRGANVSDGVDLSGLNGAPAGSAVVLDGVTALSASANLGTANRYTCGGAGCYSGTTPQGGVCLPVNVTCSGTSCAAACSCTPSTATLFASAYSPTAMCSFASCASPCLGGSTCAGANTCTAACPATATAHFSANCQAQDGTCATPCATGTCGVGGVCPSDSSTGYGFNDAVARAKVSPVAVAALAMAAALMLRN